MPMPTIRGLIDRRILVNFRVDPGVIARILPLPFRPDCVNGWAVAGICLIRLEQIRPRWLPFPFGISSENAAHRIAVRWDAGGEPRCGVYIPRRDTSCWWNVAAGGRLFPGVHHRARFEVQETRSHFRIATQSLDGMAHVRLDASVADQPPADSIFHSLADASAFFERGALGYSPRASGGKLEGLQLCCSDWHLEPLRVHAVQSSFFDDDAVFPPGSVAFDSALLMRRVHHVWHAAPDIALPGDDPAPVPDRVGESWTAEDLRRRRRPFTPRASRLE